MADLYGSFLVDGHENHLLYYEKFTTRVEALEQVAQYTKDIISKEYKGLSSCIVVNYVNVVTSCARYFNDVIRLKEMHQIKYVNKSKMLSYSFKWLTLSPVMSVDMDASKYNSLTSEEREICYNINSIFLGNVATYFFNNHALISDDEILMKFFNDIRYLTKTGLFEEHCIASLLAILATNDKL